MGSWTAEIHRLDSGSEERESGALWRMKCSWAQTPCRALQNLRRGQQPRLLRWSRLCVCPVWQLGSSTTLKVLAHPMPAPLSRYGTQLRSCTSRGLILCSPMSQPWPKHNGETPCLQCMYDHGTHPDREHNKYSGTGGAIRPKSIRFLEKQTCEMLLSRAKDGGRGGSGSRCHSCTTWANHTELKSLTPPHAWGSVRKGNFVPSLIWW